MNTSENCGPEIPASKSQAQLRIFLSYGHDVNEELVRLIRTDLEKRGHNVWFDQSEIKFGDNWRREITDGIIGSDRVLAFLSKYSTRDPGVCRDEIAIAIGVKGGNIQTVLVESEAEVQPPVNISHIQWLDMHDWKDRHAANQAEWEQWYQAKFAEISRVVESDESIKFAGEIETLSHCLTPISSDARIYELLRKGFWGREWLSDAVEGWRIDARRGSRMLWITGEPGVGKSAFAAHLANTRPDIVVAAQFVEWDKPDHRNAQRVIRSIAFQVATRLPDYRKLLLTLPEITKLDRKSDPVELFDYLLAGPLKLSISGGTERYLIVIDALDEAGDAGRNPLVDMLARNVRRLPEWLGLVVTSRPESAVLTPLQGLNPLVLDTGTEANRADIRAYLRHQLSPQLARCSNAEHIMDQILERSEGVFLYAERFCDEVQLARLSLDHVDKFPQGLGGIFFQYFQRQFPDLHQYDRVILPALGAILAATEPLPVEILQGIFSWRETELRKNLRTMGSLFPSVAINEVEVIRPYHKSLADWLTDAQTAGVYLVSVEEGLLTLAQFGDERLQKISTAGTIDDIDLFWVRNQMFYSLKCKNLDFLKRTIANETFWRAVATFALRSTEAPNSYVIGALESIVFRPSQSEFVSQVLALLPNQPNGSCCWELAILLAERARGLQLDAFDLGKKHGLVTNQIRKHLEEIDLDEFYKLRDLLYSFAALAKVAGELATAACPKQAAPAKAAREFLDRFVPVDSYLEYLSNFATTEGWSGALENSAAEAHMPWERLSEISESAP